jgi:hypothetical protein
MDMTGTDMLDDLIAPFAECLDSESLQRFSEVVMRPAVQEQIALLAERANQGLLSDEERSSYEAAINVADVMAILRLKARQRLVASNEP